MAKTAQVPCNLKYVMTSLKQAASAACLSFVAVQAAWAGGFEKPSDPFLVIGANLEARLNEDPNSGYRQLLAAALPNNEDRVVFQRLPLRRALRMFERTPRSCLFPTSEDILRVIVDMSADDMVSSVPVDTVGSHIITREGVPKVSSFEQLRGMKLAVQTSVLISQFVSPDWGYEIVRTPDEVTALRMVMAGRVDAGYGWFPDSLILAKAEGMPLPRFDENFSLYSSDTHLVCRNEPGVEYLMQVFNSRTNNLKQTGALKAMLGEFSRIVPHRR
ncbi:MAG: hypothetical protein HWE25_04850 [Alphaproteobacteria bacterium]|nr:hypothetical protein [Alphaproteobacteria bacterium]